MSGAIAELCSSCQCCCRCNRSGHESIDDDVTEPARSSVPMASFNTINSILGSGIIGLPFALREAGIGLGIVLLVFIGIITDYSMLLLIRAGEMSAEIRPTYQNVASEAFGTVGFVLVSVLQFLYPLIGMVSYNTIIGDTITKLLIRVGGETLKGTVMVQREFVIFLCTLLVTLPLSLYRDITKLSKWGAMSFGLIILIIILVAVRLATLDVPPTEGALKFANIGVPKAIGIITFAYINHHNCFLVYASLKEPNQGNWAKVTHVSIVFCIQAALSLSITGYLTFTGHTEGDLMQNYCSDDDVMNVGRFVFAFVVMLTFPIECFVTREVIENAVFSHKQPPSLARHVTLTVILVTLAMLLSFTTDCLGIILELNGVLAASPLAFIWPPLLVLKLQKKSFFSVSTIPMVIIMTFGIFSTLFGITMALMELVQGLQCIHGSEPSYCVPINNTSLNTFWSAAVNNFTTMPESTSEPGML